jgi:hypothetical protein
VTARPKTGPLDKPFDGLKPFDQLDKPLRPDEPLSPVLSPVDGMIEGSAMSRQDQRFWPPRRSVDGRGRGQLDDLMPCRGRLSAAQKDKAGPRRYTCRCRRPH